jgi:hypothetical protein
LLEIGEQISPAWDGLRDAEAEKGEGHFGEHILRNEDPGLGQKDAESFGKNVPAEEIDVGGAEASGGADEVALFGAEYDATNEASGARPTDRGNDTDNQEEGLKRIYREREKGPDGKQEIEPWQGEEKFGDAHQDIVLPTAKAAGCSTNAPADDQGESCTEETGEQRDLATEEKPG